MRFAMFLLLFAIPLHICAQYDYLDIPVQKNGSNSPVALAGGLNAPQFSAVDLNNDGIKDLLIYDRSGQIALPFLNNGTPNQVDYQYAPEFFDRFPQNTENYMLLRDYNGDGIEDLFYFTRTTAYPGGGSALLKGNYDNDNKIFFIPVDSTLMYLDTSMQPSPLYISNIDLPAIDDIDGDGDMDILTFSTKFGFTRNIAWYKNMSVENGNGLAAPEYYLEHECWGMVTETNINNTVLLSPGIDSCPDNTFWIPPAATNAPRHAGSTLTAIDYNGDGVKDMVMGDASINTLNMMTSSTVNDTFLITTQDPLYPSYDTPTDMLSFPAAFFFDANNDGILDMIASPNELGTSLAITDSVAWYYQNTQSNTNIQLSFQQKDFLVGDMIDLGQDANPIFFDYNADGLLDILIGHFAYYRNDGSDTTGLTLLENTGTASNPSFVWQTNNYANLDTMNLLGMHPTVGDIDNDGDQDLLLGANDGTLTFIENTAGPAATAVWASPVRNYMNIDVDEFSTPQWVDLDRDGDLDLAIGEFNGNINYHINTGTANSAAYASAPDNFLLSGYDIHVMNPGSRRSAPCFFEVDGHFELFIGHQNGMPVHLKNIDGNIMGSYDTTSNGISSLFTGRYSDLDVADINNDNRLDIVIGNNRGGISFYSVDTLTVNVPKIADTKSTIIENLLTPIQPRIF